MRGSVLPPPGLVTVATQGSTLILVRCILGLMTAWRGVLTAVGGGWGTGRWRDRVTCNVEVLSIRFVCDWHSYR